MVYVFKNTIVTDYHMTSTPTSSIVSERLPYLALSAGVVIIDRLTKFFIDQRFGLGEGLTVVPGFFDLNYVQNTGVAFGLFASSGSPFRVVLLSGFAVAAAVIVVIYSVQSPVSQRLLQTALALILGGALGNLYDRLVYGYVVDFLEFYLGSYSWPTFNIADTAISIGVGVLAIEVIRDEIRSRA